VLSCTDSAGGAVSYPVDLNASETFASRPLDIGNEPGIDRLALTGDPMSRTQAELSRDGYGLRPDPVASPTLYAAWLEAARKPGRMLFAKRPDKHAHTVTTEMAPAWIGSVLTGSAPYVSISSTFEVPTAVPGAFGTTSTVASIWPGLGGFNTGSGLIQAGVSISTTPTAASYSTWREYCCGDGDSNGYGGAFTPSPGDKILAQAWYCDANGQANVNGGFGCSYLYDFRSGAVFSCTIPKGSSSNPPCWSVKALPQCSSSPTVPNCMTMGAAAEFIFENQSPQLTPPTDQFPPFAPSIVGTYDAVSTTGKVTTAGDDPAIIVLKDWPHKPPQVLVTLSPIGETVFQLDSPRKSMAAGIVSWGANRLDIFGLGTDNQMYHKAWDGSWYPSQTGWEGLGGKFNSPPTVVSWGPNRLDIFALGTDDQMYHKAWNGSWYPSQTGWEALGGKFNSPPAVVSWGPNRLDIFALGTDDQMYHKAWNGNWSPSQTGWEALGGTFNSPPAVASWGPNRLDIFGLGTDNQMYHKAWDGSWYPSQTNWEALGGTFDSPPAVVSWGVDRLDIFALGTDNQMCHKAWSGNWYPSQAGWEPLGGTFDSPPAVVSWGPNRLDIFGLGTDDRMFHKAWAGNWYPSQVNWEALGGTFDSSPAIASWGANRLDIFGLGTDNQMFHKAWAGNWYPSPAGWEALGGVFNVPPPKP
jgi:hypothetical protein